MSNNAVSVRVDAPERLEISPPLGSSKMLGRLSKTHDLVQSQSPHPGRPQGLRQKGQEEHLGRSKLEQNIFSLTPKDASVPPAVI